MSLARELVNRTRNQSNLLPRHVCIHCICIIFENIFFGSNPMFIMSPHPKEKGDILLLVLFGVGVRVRVVSCLHSISWTNLWILAKLAQTHYWKGGKNWLDFDDIDLIFKVTSVLWMSNDDQKQLVCILSLEQNDGFWPNFTYCIIGMVKRFD